MSKQKRKCESMTSTERDKVVWLEIDPGSKYLRKKHLRQILRAEKCSREGHANIIQVTVPGEIQHIIDSRQEILRLLGIMKYRFLDTEDWTEIQSNTEKVLSLLLRCFSLYQEDSHREFAHFLNHEKSGKKKLKELLFRETTDRVSIQSQLENATVRTDVLQRQNEELVAERETVESLLIKKLGEIHDMKERLKYSRASKVEELEGQLQEKEKLVFDLNAKVEELERELEERGMKSMVKEMVSQGTLTETMAGERKALFVATSWSKNVDRLNVVNTSLASSLSMEDIPTYSTTLHVCEQSVSTDEATCVRLLNISADAVKQSHVKTPSQCWCIHKGNYIFPEPIGVVVGHVLTGEGRQLLLNAITLKKYFKPAPKLFLVNHEVPEDSGDSELEERALEEAKKSVAIWSVGPYVYEHFAMKYKALHQPPLHFCYYPSLMPLFTDIKMKSPCAMEGKQQIITVCEVKARKDFKQYHLFVKAMERVADKRYQTTGNRIVWKLIGVSESIQKEFKQDLVEISKCRHLDIIPQDSINCDNLATVMKQSVLLVAPQCKDPFNMAAFLAMQAGLPVLVPRSSGIHKALEALFPNDDYASYFSVNVGIHEHTDEEDITNWEDKIHTLIRCPSSEANEGAPFHQARVMKEAMIIHKQFEDCKQEFIDESKKHLNE